MYRVFEVETKERRGRNNYKNAAQPSGMLFR
jgi:hypothetical protein